MDQLLAVPPGTLALLGLCLLIALGFEFVNGFHDTANAVATVIYTRSLRPGIAVAWSGFCNFLGVLFAQAHGAAVAFAIVYLLPVDLLLNVGSGAGVAMVLALLTASIAWNVGTWYFGLPASSSHALIGSIIGVGVTSSLLGGRGFGQGVNWSKALDVGKALFFSPLIGFFLAAALLLLMRAVIKNRELYEAPHADRPPPFWIRAILCLTCTGVSFAHGSNDGQKGIGLIMLILIGLLPAQYALNPDLGGSKVQELSQQLASAEQLIRQKALPGTSEVLVQIANVRTDLAAETPPLKWPAEERTMFRHELLATADLISKHMKQNEARLSPQEQQVLKTAIAGTRGSVNFVSLWVAVAVAIALGLGTMIGWKRIVVTVGEKIGKSHLTYAQGAAAEVVAMGMIIAADVKGLPVSTTHVLSSGIAGTMAANKSGLQLSTIRNIALAWILTLPITALLAGLLFYLFGGWNMHDHPTLQTHVPVHHERVHPRLE